MNGGRRVLQSPGRVAVRAPRQGFCTASVPRSSFGERLIEPVCDQQVEATGRKRRAPNVDGAMAMRITKVIARMEGDVTWEAVIAAVAEQIGPTYTRQALHRSKPVFAAYRTRAAGAPPVGPGRPRSKEHLRDLERIAKLQEQLEWSNRRDDFLTAKFRRWAKNASLAGMTEEQLDAE